MGAVMLLALAGFFLWRASNQATAETPTVAVLPFEQRGQNEAYFASGVSDEILNLLSHQARFRVLGRMTSKEVGKSASALQTARRLGITHVLDGSVTGAGDKMLVIARLTRVADGAQLWSERYERAAGDIFAVQGDIARSVAGRLARSLTPSVARVTDPEVYDRFLAARQLLRERREMTLVEAARLLREAIRIDPNYAPALAELAQVNMLLADHPVSDGKTPISQARREAEALARRAIALDPNLGDAYAALGFLTFSDASSEPLYRKAVALAPQRSEFHRWHAQSLIKNGRYDEAVAEYRRAVGIDPLWGLNYDHLAGTLVMLGRAQEARALVRRRLQLRDRRRSCL